MFDLLREKHLVSSDCSCQGCIFLDFSIFRKVQETRTSCVSLLHGFEFFKLSKTAMSAGHKLMLYLVNNPPFRCVPQAIRCFLRTISLCLATNRMSISQHTDTQRSERTGLKQCHMDMTVPWHSWTHSSFGQDQPSQQASMELEGINTLNWGDIDAQRFLGRVVFFFFFQG